MILLVYTLVFLPCGLCVKDLYILGLFPMDGTGWSGGLAIRTAAEIALEHINSMEGILDNYRLNLIWNNTKCHAGTGINNMYSNLYAPPTKIIVLGAGCSFVSEATAQASHMWNLVQISWGSVSPALSDKNKFPRFFRANPPDVDVNPAKVKMFKRFNWAKVATIHQSYELFSAPTENMLLELTKENMTVLRSEIITDDPAVQVKSLMESGARIIVGSFYENVARKVFCEVYKNKLYGPKFVWILVGWYEAKWWLTEDTGCTKEQLGATVEGSFFISRVNSNPKNQVSIGGIRSSEFWEIYNSRSNNGTLFGSQFACLSYDSVWAIALALNASQAELDNGNTTLDLTDFSYDDDTVGSIIYNNMKKVELMGTAGPLSFDDKGDPIGLYTINRIQGGQETIIGLYNPNLEEAKQIDWLVDANPIVWENGKIPRDSMLVIVEEDHLIFALYLCMCCACGLGLALSICFFVFNWYFRDLREVKMSSPRLNNVTLVGCFLLYTTPFLENTYDTTDPGFCSAKGFLLTLGFSLTFGALFVKTWRVHVIFTNSSKKKMVVKDSQLLGMVAALVAINMAVLLTWVFVDPMRIISYKQQPQINDIEDTSREVVVKLCESSKQTYFLATLFALQGILLLLGAFLAWETRKVKLDGLNDSKMIGMCVYNILVLSLLGVTVSFALKNQINVNYALTSVIVILGTTVTQCLIFVPKMFAVKNCGNQVDDLGELGTVNGRMQTTTGTLMPSTAVTAQRLITLEKTLMEKNKEIDSLKADLEALKK